MCISDRDRKVIENKYHKTDEQFDGFNRMAYHGYDYDNTTGLSDAEIDRGLESISNFTKNEPHSIIKARLVEYVLDNTRIDINENDYFIGMYSWGRLIDKYTVSLWYDEAIDKASEKIGNNKIKEFGETGTAFLGLDFDHTVPDWESMSELGFVGILERLEKSYAEKSGKLTEKQEICYRAIKIEYEAVIRFVKRLYEYSLTKKFEKAEIISESLKNLCTGSPQNTYDMLQMMYIYFMISESIEHYQVRSLGYGLDATLYPFFKKDIDNGVFTKEELIKFIEYFLLQFHAMGNYWGQPMYLAGTNADGTTKVNELSYIILDIMNSLGIYNPKIQIKISDSTPREFVNKALDMIIYGSTSIVFCNEDIIVKSMMRSGATYEQAIDSVDKGCYEYAVKAGSIGISFNTFNALKPISLVFDRGYDRLTDTQVGIDTGDVTAYKSFGEFYNAYLEQFGYIIKT